MADEGLELRLQMSIRPAWRNADILRSAVLTCMKAVSVEGGEHDDSMIGNVASELVENAIKYGKWDDAKGAPLEVRLASDGHMVEMAVANPTSPDSRHFEELHRTIEWIRSFPTPQDAYLARMKMLLEHTTTGSRMGLVRIAHEGPCELEVELSSDGKRLTVKATTRIA